MLLHQLYEHEHSEETITKKMSQNSVQNEESSRHASCSASFYHRFSSLKKAPKEMWLMFIIKFCDSIAYYSLTRIMTLMLSEVFGYGDMGAGAIYGVYGSLITLYGVFAGFLIDRYGIIKVNNMGICLSLLGRCTLLFLIFHTSMRDPLLLTSLLFFLPIGNALLILVSTISVKRYTDGDNCGIALGIFFSVSNCGYLVSGIMVDLIRKSLKENIDASYKAILFTGVMATLIAAPLGVYMNRNDFDKAGSDDDILSTGVDIDNPVHLSEARVLPQRESRSYRNGNYKYIVEMFISADFWRFIAVSIIVANTKMVIRHMDCTMPKYMIRTFGENVPFGLMSAINPAIVIFLGPIITAGTCDVRAPQMILLGMFITSSGIIFVTVWPNYMWSVLTFLLIISIGECMWGPRFHELSLKLSEDGKEGVFVAFAFMPPLFTRFPTGVLSGYLLQTFCPSDGICHGGSIWGVILGVSVLSPLLLSLFWPILIVNKTDEQEHIGDPHAIEINEECARIYEDLSEPLI